MELLKSLFENAELPADFQEKTKTLFEAAVAESVKAELTALQESFDAKLVESKEAYVTESVALIDKVVEETILEWAKENAIPLDTQIKGQIAESFLSGLKGLFEKADIELSGDTAGSEIAKLHEQLAEATKIADAAKTALVESESKLVQLKIKEIIESVTAGLADTVAHRVATLCEAFDFKSEEDFKSKVALVLEAVTGAKVKGTMDADGVQIPVTGGAAVIAQVDGASGSEPAPEVVTKPAGDSADPYKSPVNGTPVKTQPTIKTEAEALREMFNATAAEHAPHLNSDLVAETMKLFNK